MDDPRDVLRSAEGVSDWILTRATRVENQRYLLADRPEMVRTVEDTRLMVTVFHDHDRGRGRARLTLTGGDRTLETSSVEEAVFAAGLQANESWRLPEARPLADVALADPELERAPGRVMAEIEERVMAAAAREESVRLTSAELFVSRTETEIATSAGVEAGKVETSALLEVVLVARRGHDETESLASYPVRRLADLDVEGIIARHAQRARDALVAPLPPTRTGAVVLTGPSFLPLFTPFRYATSAESVYRGVSPLAVGQPLLGERDVVGDTLDLTSDATLDWGAESTPFDDEGLALAAVPIVTDGQLTALAAPKRYADYLGIDATGGWHNTVLGPGATPVAELLAADGQPVIEVVEFSWLNPDPVQGRFSTEIRLAYLHGPDGPRPLKGGAFAASSHHRHMRLVDSTIIQLN